jgi:hypothetical protein
MWECGDIFYQSKESVQAALIIYKIYYIIVALLPFKP